MPYVDDACFWVSFRFVCQACASRRGSITCFYEMLAWADIILLVGFDDAFVCTPTVNSVACMTRSIVADGDEEVVHLFFRPLGYTWRQTETA